MDVSGRSHGAELTCHLLSLCLEQYVSVINILNMLSFDYLSKLRHSGPSVVSIESINFGDSGDSVLCPEWIEIILGVRESIVDVESTDSILNEDTTGETSESLGKKSNAAPSTPEQHPQGVPILLASSSKWMLQLVCLVSACDMP